MNPKAEIFFDAITLLDAGIVEEAQDYAFHRRVPWRRYGVLAACLALAACLGWYGLASSFRMGSAAPANGAPPASEAAPAAQEPGDAPAETDGAPSGGADAGAQRQFSARVLEVSGDAILVEPLEGGTGPVLVSTDGLDVPELAEGDLVRVTYRGTDLDGGLLEITETQSIEKYSNHS